MWPLLWFPIDEEECDLGWVFIYFTNIYKEPLKKKKVNGVEGLVAAT